MASRVDKVSIARAVTIGHLAVTVPVLVFLGAGAFAWVALDGVVGGWSALFYLCGILFAWLWWSLFVPRWRIWAYRRVESIPEVLRWAVRTGLVWPRGWLFERTEIKSASQAAEQHALERGHA